MRLLTNKEIITLVQEEKIVVTPLLQENQIGQSAIDLRLGTRFNVSKQIRQPLIDVEDNIIQFFDKTYSDFGQNFILYPNQLVIGSTFEFIKIPNNIMAQVLTRSSVNRLGIQISSIIQPGYIGTLSLELINKGATAIKLKPGMRIIQIILYDIEDEDVTAYTDLNGSKYIANVEPHLSSIKDDYDFSVLRNMK